MFRFASLGLVLFALTACDESGDFSEFALTTARELEMKVEGLQARADALAEEVKKAPPAAAGEDGPPRDPAREKAAYEAYQATMAALQGGDYDAAKAKLLELEKFTDVPPAVNAVKEIRAEIELIGKPATELKVDKWFVGQAGMDDGKATVLVFWEVWCPHCKREVRKLEETYAKHLSLLHI